MRNVYKIWLEGLEGREENIQKPRWRWEDNIRMDLRKVGLEGVTQVRDW
jgi:hypothetical protein